MNDRGYYTRVEKYFYSTNKVDLLPDCRKSKQSEDVVVMTDNLVDFRKQFTLIFTTMKNLIIAASICALVAVSQSGFAQAVQEGKAAKKEMKADKKIEKAKEDRMAAKEHKGIEIKGISDPKTRMAKAQKKMEKAEKKEMKEGAKELKSEAKLKTKKADKLN